MKHINIDLPIIEIQHSSGVKLLSLLHLESVMRLEEPAAQVANTLHQAIHKDWLKQGIYDFLLTQYQVHEVEQAEFILELSASEEKIFPDLTLKFDLLYYKNEQNYHLGFLPVLNVESSGNSFDELLLHLKENVLLEFMRKKRFHHFPALLATQWFEELKVHQIPVDFEFYTLSELDKIQEQQHQGQELLPEIAQRMQPQGTKALFGLEKEFEQLTDALKGRSRNSVLVVGGAGKGKTALIKELNEQKHLHGLGDLVIWEVSAAQLLHRLSGMGAWEEYLGILCKELRKKGHALYVPNFAELFEVGQYVGNNLSMGDFLRDFIARGEIVLISECSPEATAQIELRTPGYLSLLTNIRITEQTATQIIEIVRQKVQQIGMAKSTLIEDNAIQETLRLQKWFTPYSELPGKTIHFLHALIADKEKSEIKIIDKKSVYERFSQETGMPEFMINPEAALDIKAMYDFFYQNIFGQNEAIETIIDLLIAVKAAVIRRGKPLASLLFVGPTGVGKTEMAKVLAEFMFGNRDKMIRFDMSEYADLQGIMRLTGDGGGEGLLTAAVRQAPFSVLLFDELEKVHPAFYDLLLQILGEGRLTDARGRVADFCSTIIIMTSNIGARSFQTGSIGFGEPSNLQETASAHFKSQVQAFFRPELFNRLDRIIAFAPLEKGIVRKITDREIGLIKQREGIRNRKLSLDLPKEVLDYLSEVGYNAQYGARFLQRALQEKFVLPLSQLLNQQHFEEALAVQVKMEDNGLQFEMNPAMKNTSSDFYLAQQVHKQQLENTQYYLAKVVQSRRMASAIETGSYYAKLLSQYDQLERKRKSLEKKKKLKDFWNDELLLKKYYAIQKLKDELQESFLTIQALELDFLVALKQGEEDTQSSTKVNDYTLWLEIIKELKSALVKAENPQFLTCSLGLYITQGGDRYMTLKMADVYEQVGIAIGCLVEKKKVFKDTIHNEFVKMDFYTREIPPHFDLVGAEIGFQGECMPFLYFKEEDGIHSIISEIGVEHSLFVSVSYKLSEKKANQPEKPVTSVGEDIRRNKNRKKAKPRRWITIHQHFKDNKYYIDKDYEDLNKTLTEILTTQSYAHIDQYLFWKEGEF